MDAPGCGTAAQFSGPLPLVPFEDALPVRSAQAIQAAAISSKIALSLAELFSAKRRHSAAY